jgi:endonuclease III-like uncharacterized protein
MDKLFETVKKCYFNFYHSHVQIVKSLNTIENYLDEVTSQTTKLNLNDEAKGAFKECKQSTNSHLNSTESFMYYAMKLYKRLFIYKTRNVDELKEISKNGRKHNKEPRQEFNYKR